MEEVLVGACLARQVRTVSAVLAVLVLSVLAGCGNQDAASNGADAGNDKFRVVTTFTVIQDIAQNVAGDAAVVSSITKPGAEIHDYQPTPGDIVKAQDADLVLLDKELMVDTVVARGQVMVRNKEIEVTGTFE